MVEVEQRLRNLLTDDHLALRVPAGTVEAIHAGVRRRRRRARVASAAGVVAIAASVAAVAVPVALERTSRVSPGGTGNQATPIWKPGPITTLPAAVSSPTSLAVSGGIVWGAGPAGGEPGGDVLARMDAASRQVTTTVTGAVADMAATPQHLWVALRSCTLVLRETTHGKAVSTFPLPCDVRSGAGPTVTANGKRAWVASDDGSRTHVRLYTAGQKHPTAEGILAGRLAGSHLLAIGGNSVYVVTHTSDGSSLLHELSATDLKPVGETVSLANPRLMAFGSGQLYVAGADGVVAYAPDLTSPHILSTGAVTRLTTGDGLVWCDPNGASGLEGLDPSTGEVIGIAEIGADPDELVRADGAVLWTVKLFTSVGVDVQSARAAG